LMKVTFRRMPGKTFFFYLFSFFTFFIHFHFYNLSFSFSFYKIKTCRSLLDQVWKCFKEDIVCQSIPKNFCRGTVCNMFK
jgi:hypothetical protein